jgi:hypothetical protein
VDCVNGDDHMTAFVTGATWRVDVAWAKTCVDTVRVILTTQRPTTVSSNAHRKSNTGGRRYCTCETAMASKLL